MDGVNSIAGMRKIYQLETLLEKDMDEDPIKQFEAWWQYAILSKIEEPNTMSLATCSASGKPSVRTVLLKGLRENGFIFFTNYESRKGKEIAENPFVALLFFWKELERQVRIEGKIQKSKREKKKIDTEIKKPEFDHLSFSNDKCFNHLSCFFISFFFFFSFSLFLFLSSLSFLSFFQI